MGGFASDVARPYNRGVSVALRHLFFTLKLGFTVHVLRLRLILFAQPLGTAAEYRLRGNMHQPNSMP
jgi:hypothetical protein